MIDSNSKKILKYLKNRENEVIFRKDLNNILKNSELENIIIAQLIKDDLVSYGDLGPDRIYIRLKGKEALLDASIVGWIKRHFKEIIVILVGIIGLYLAWLGINN